MPQVYCVWEVRFVPVTGVRFSEMNLDEYSAIPQGTSMIWDYSAADGATLDAVVPAEEGVVMSVAEAGIPTHAAAPGECRPRGGA